LELSSEPERRQTLVLSGCFSSRRRLFPEQATNERFATGLDFFHSRQCEDEPASTG
jgi:hypothetical protein